MKKAIFTLLILTTLIITQANACVCAGQISSSYNDFKNHISSKLNAQLESLKKLNNSLKQNTDTLSSQNELLVKHNALIKHDALKEKELIFKLTQKNEMR